MTAPTSRPREKQAAAFSRLLLASSVLCLVFLALFFVRAATGREYSQHQRAYRDLLATRPLPTDGKPLAFPIRLRQVVLPDQAGIDRCVSCHVGLEDPAMIEAEQPLRTHPGAYLQDHDVTTVGCVLCHDGEGRALDRRTAHGRAPGGRPLLPLPFMQANCVRCHAPDAVPELEQVRRGYKLFAEKQCLTCHELDRKGGRLAPDLTRIGDAHPNQKAPVSLEEAVVADRFGGSVNVAYIYESLRHPQLQPGASFMPDFKFEEDDLVALAVFLKSLSDRGAPEALQARQWREGVRGGRGTMGDE